jgi:hypothetical protein
MLEGPEHAKELPLRPFARHFCNQTNNSRHNKVRGDARDE